ncbi:hypothetical protein MUO32_26325 [Shinella sp. CPCC 101442]|uniref:hypothetical protein n=1 Tax=Shinella sp. CPCC 101442 TaxID=2932265 RepID=UPI0021527DA6|nr:hypothetical protein [Shinella sp. CPCC 101442]MCR6502548.1 hypothetical protein [Shinella sp. CPCC 101442]
MQTEADRIATRVAQELSKPHGYMVTRLWVMDAAGLYYAGKGEFSYEQDDAIQFEDEAEAEEASERHPGTTVERFERWSRYPDLVADPKDRALSEALNFVQHWRRDRDVNLAPTLESLNHVETVLRNAIASAA